MALAARTIQVGNRRTSVRLEPEYWHTLREIAAQKQTTLEGLVYEIHATRPEGFRRPSFTSWIRVFCLRHVRDLYHEHQVGEGGAP